MFQHDHYPLPYPAIQEEEESRYKSFFHGPNISLTIHSNPLCLSKLSLQESRGSSSSGVGVLQVRSRNNERTIAHQIALVAINSSLGRREVGDLAIILL